MARIVLFTISMHEMAGGLERNIVYLANSLANDGHQVDLITFDFPNASTFYPIDSQIRWHCLGRTKPHGGISFSERFSLIRRIRNTLFAGKQNCDFIICFHHGLLARILLANLFKRTKVICSERNALTLYDHTSTKKWNLNFFLLLLVEKITVQFSSYKQDYPIHLRKKITSIHNPVFPPPIQKENRTKTILSIGRHCSQKQFDLLIKAFYLAREKNYDWELVIIGDGPLTSTLSNLISDLKLENKVHLIPPQKSLLEWYSNASLYCQPSLWEGFPNAQAEAMSHGVIPIGFSSTRGVADLIQEGENGYLCHGDFTAENLASSLSNAMTDTKSHRTYSLEAKKVTTTYSPKSWKSKWDRILK